MKRGGLVSAGCAAFAVFGLFLPARALACRCKEPASVAAAHKAARAVIVARVIEVRPAPDVDGLTAVVSVSRAWKRDVPARLTIVSGTTCKYDLEPDHEYILFLARDPKMQGSRGAETYTTAICLGNKPLPAGQEAVHWLEGHRKTSSVLPAP